MGNKYIDIAEFQTEEGRLYLLVAIDRASRYAYTKAVCALNEDDHRDFLRNLFKAVPYKILT